MSDTRVLSLPAGLLLTAQTAITFRASSLELSGYSCDYAPKLRKIVEAISQHQSDMVVIESWTPDELLGAAENMELYGGHFARHIAGAFYAADSHNRGVLVAAFAELFLKYGKGGAFWQENKHVLA